MKPAIIILLVVTSVFVSCKNSEDEIDRVELVEHYYNILNEPDYSEAERLFSDSLIMKEGAYDQITSRADYVEILKWDAVFNPVYDVLGTQEEEHEIKVKVSKMDKRIGLLHEKPFITQQIFKFEEGRIAAIETQYLNFDEKTWEGNKTAIVNWIKENHPELNGFIHDQTKSGGKRFLRAMDLFNNR